MIAIRENISTFLYYTFAYAYPSFSSIRAVIKREDHLIEQQLVYWTVLSICTIIGTFLSGKY
jgi:hypothetical protein